MSDTKQAIQQMKVLQAASPSSLAALAPAASLKTLAKGEHLFWDKDPVDHFYFVAKGNFSLYKLSSQGEKKVVFVYGPREMLNEVMVQDLGASISCEALSPGQVLCFPKPAFLQVMEQDFRLSKAVMDSMATKIRRLYRQLKNTTGSVRGDKKIAAKLWKLSKDYGTPTPDGLCIDLDLSITYLAEMLGSQRETVSRQMKTLVDKGLVTQKNGRFILPDPAALQTYFKEP